MLVELELSFSFFRVERRTDRHDESSRFSKLKNRKYNLEKFRRGWWDAIASGIKKYEGNETKLVLVRHEKDILELMYKFRVKSGSA